MIDPVLDYDPADGTVDTRSAERVLDAAEEQGLTITHVLETHAHADHLSAAPFFKAKTGAKIGIGARIRDVQKVFRPMFCADDLKVDGSDFDLLLNDGERHADRRARDRGDRDARAHGGRRQLPDRRCRVRRRHAVHAGLRHRADRLPGRRCPPALSLDPEAARPAAGNAAVHVPRLQGAGPRRISLGDDGRASSGATFIWPPASPRTSSSRCARRATRRCRRRSCCCPRSR